ncbi:MAG: hypothetical protein JOY96_07200 [Verrucomicrobia bacterium]|nr:hypothetical protein [Verrucomicrobiota bacterium]
MRPDIFLSALMGAGVEFLEIVAIAYALARSGFAQEALWGSIVGIVVVGVASAALGTRLMLVPLRLLQLFAGVVLLYFGWKWVQKSVRRSAAGKRAGWITNPLEGALLEPRDPSGFSCGNFLVMAKSAALEAFEIAMIVTTIALSSKAWIESLAGMIAALVLTISVVCALHGVLVKLPDVLLKLGAGLLLLSFGTFWLGEATGLEWPWQDFSVLFLFCLYAISSLIAIRWLQIKADKNRPAQTRS